MIASKTDKLAFELKCMAEGAKYICGIDEVGRGPLAGPVTCTAIIMRLDDVIEGVDDSKKLSENKREELFELILSHAVAVSTESLDNRVIDKINILEATKRCMNAAICNLKIKPDVILSDAINLNVGIRCIPIIGGDGLSYTIGAASIIAKVLRDRLMRKYDEIYPEYDFKNNKGYGTKTHLDAIKRVGASEIHRLTFLKKLLLENG
ncbi:MAG: ribonuclease HII [Christensenellales bacterium]|jgi:ribonuclease HII|nr:ribonuclease HII [Clostridia bacterium]HRU84001.1 ribonuclease HII [Eubacteriales bacterium]